MTRSGEALRAASVALIAACLTSSGSAHADPTRESNDSESARGTVAVNIRSSEPHLPVRIYEQPEDPAQRTGGLLLGIAGAVALVAGGVLMLSDVCADSCTPHPEAKAAGTGLVIGGGVASLLGWLLFAGTFRPEVEETPIKTAR
jgi:hypothetical protein